jgi:hypothetical protein
MASPLLDQQLSLLEYLTSGAAIFVGTDDIPLAGAASGPFGIDPGLLHLEARYSHEKRMAKIKWVLRRTFELLGADRERIVRGFAVAHPPKGIGRLENAGQFHDYLKACWQQEAHAPAYLPDVAAFELAYAKVRGSHAMLATAPPESVRQRRPRAFRRNPQVVLLRCSYDIRPLLEDGLGEQTPARSDCRFALSMPAGAADPVVLAVSSGLFDVLEILDDFTDPKIFENVPGGDNLIEELAAEGFLEVSR